jgi:DNA-binding SARP family transcriptional activator/tetratricopeptide (TPR) repeat protein
MLEAEAARLQVRLFGGFQVMLDGVPLVRFRSAKARTLLAYLAVEAGRRHRREALAALLWGEYPERDAQRSLSQALTNLRSLLAPLACAAPAEGEAFLHPPAEPCLEITGQAVQLHPRPGQVWLDVHAFDALLAAADPRRGAAPEVQDVTRLLAQAVDLYTGPFLAGLSLPDSPAFEEWRLLQQEQRHQAALLALERLVGHHLAEGHTDEAQRAARRQLALEPWSEAAQQSLMLALALGGQRGAALRQYETCRRVLGEELGVEPSPETEALRRQIRDGTWSDLAPAAPTRPDGPGGLSPAAFVARERELARLDRCLELALGGQGRVALVTGEAGSGKTALLAQFARRAVQAHRRLVAAGGRCSAWAGLGDPFLPFREILHSLCGEGGTGWAGGGNPDHARRLWALFPAAAEALVEAGPDLIGRFVSAEGLEARAKRLAPPGAAWRTRLAELQEHPPSVPPHASAGAGSAAAGGRAAGPSTAPLQEALFEQITRVLQALARHQPLLLLLDDLQWADAASLSLLFHLGRQLAGSRILVVGAYRPSELLQDPAGLTPLGSVASIANEFARQWGDIRVDLDGAGGRRFVDALLDSEPNRLGDAFRDRVTRHTAGHALFTVELLRAFQERGELVRGEDGRWLEGPAPHGEGLPPRVEAAIAERIGRLPPEWHRVLEAASVEGESFNAEVVARALGLEAAWVREVLSGPLSGESKLVEAVGVQRLAGGGEALSHYRFGHALVHEYVHGRLDAVQGARLHGQVGVALEGLCRGVEAALAEASPQLAHHYEQAGLADRAAHFCLRAGRRATRLTAFEEAIALYRRGLALLAQGPDPPPHTRESDERSRRQIELYLALDAPLFLTRGWGAPERAEALLEAHRLALRLGEPQPIMHVLLLLADLHTWLGETGAALDRAEELLRRAGQEHDPFYLAAGHLAAGLGHLQQGHLAASREHLEQALELGPSASTAVVQPEQRPVRPPLLPVAGLDLAAASLAWLSAVLAMLGLADQAQARSRQALASLPELDDPLTALLLRMVEGTLLHILRREPAAVQANAEQLAELVERRALSLSKAWAAFYLGLAQVQRGEPEAGLAAMRSSLAGVHRGGSQAFRPMLYGTLAEAHLQAGQAGGGLEVLAALGPHAGQPYEAEVYRLRGELLLAGTALTPPAPSPQVGRGGVEEAEACFRRALEAARAQGARLFELRAAVSLARLWHAQGRRDEAHALLAWVYGGFTEGFDTRDLVEAHALLDQLRPA